MIAVRILIAATLVLALGGCGARKERPAGPKAVQAVDWRVVATPADRARLRNWRDSWVAALAQARGQDSGTIARDPALFDPDRALVGATPPAGDYRCRVSKLGAADAFLPAFISYPAFNCRVSDQDGIVRLAKLDGSQRPVGRLYPESDTRAVFLGTLALGDERTAMPYGLDAGRDMAGIVERIGPRRWRLVLPAPRYELKLDVIELVPAS